MNTLIIGKLIKRLREEKNYTQQYVAEQLGISQSSYCRVENDISEISVANLLKLINCLESSLEDFLQIENNNSLQNLPVSCIHSEKIDKIINEYALQDELLK